jgi:hypothetical protein
MTPGFVRAARHLGRGRRLGAPPRAAGQEARPKQTSTADSEKGGTHFGFVLYDQKGDLAYRSGTPMTRKLSRAETSAGDAFSVARAGSATHFVISAEDARPLIAEVALYYARMLIASALSHARNADGECTASI